MCMCFVHGLISVYFQAVVDVLKFYTATTGEIGSSETKFMTVSKKIGEEGLRRSWVTFKIPLSLGANTMGPILESSQSSPMVSSRPKVNDDVFSPLQPVTKQYDIVVTDCGFVIY